VDGHVVRGARPIPAEAGRRSAEVILRIDGLRKSYRGVEVLRGIDLRVHAGEVASLLGPNGAGKSTIVSIVAGLRRADAGSITVAGVDALARSRAARRMIGLAPQELAVCPVLDVAGNLRLFGELAGLRGRALRARIGEVAAGLGLDGLLNRQVGRLSGGQKRRVHTAMALMHRPRLLLLDEVTAGSDVESRACLVDLVRKLAAEGAAVLYSTHYLPEVEMLGASVVLLEAGAVLARGTVPELVAEHAVATVEFGFVDPPPVAIPAGATQRRGNVLRVATADPAGTIVAMVRSLGDDAGRLRSVEIVQANLETVYLALTGRRYSPEGGGAARNATGPAGATGRRP